MGKKIVCTIVVIGAPGVGKTSVISRLNKDKFKSSPDSTKVEKFSEFSVPFKQSSIVLRTIDTSGERDVFREHWKQWFVQSSGVIVVFSVALLDSFAWATKVVQALLLNKDTKDKKLPFALIGTFADSSDRQVPLNTILEFVSSVGCIYKEYSCKNQDRSALIPQLQSLLEQMVPDDIHNHVRNIVRKSIALTEVLETLNTNEADEFGAVLNSVRYTFRYKIDVESLRGNSSQFKKLCDKLGKLEEIVDVYAAMVQKLAKQGKLAKMLGESRTRQKFEKVTSKLEHQRSDIQSFLHSNGVVPPDSVASTSRTSGGSGKPAGVAPQPAPRSPHAPPAPLQPPPRLALHGNRIANAFDPPVDTADADTNSREMDAGSVVDDSDARAFWLHSFGAQTYQTPFERFAVALAAVAIEDDDKRFDREALEALEAVLDRGETGFVNVYKFASFARGFAPLKGSVDRLKTLLEKNWFVGFATSSEATRLLAGRNKGCFVVRFSKSRPGRFAIAYVDPSVPGGVNHARISSRKDGGVMINKTPFKDLYEMIRVYRSQGVLGDGLDDNTAKHDWFYGELNANEAETQLRLTPVGTFLVRFDESRVDYSFVVSFVQSAGRVVHAPVRRSDDDSSRFTALSFEIQSPNVAPNVATIIEANHSILIKPAPRSVVDDLTEEMDPLRVLDELYAGTGELDGNQTIQTAYRNLPTVSSPMLKSSGSDRYQNLMVSPTSQQLGKADDEDDTDVDDDTEPLYSVPAGISSIGAVKNAVGLSRKSHAEPALSESLGDYGELGEQRFSKFFGKSTPALTNEAQHTSNGGDNNNERASQQQVGAAATTATAATAAASSRDSTTAAPGVSKKQSIADALRRGNSNAVSQRKSQQQLQSQRGSNVVSPRRGVTPVRRLIQDGNAFTEDNGKATISLPMPFVKKCSEFRYVLTPIGRYAPLFVSSEVDKQTGTFQVSAGQIVKFSWQVVGIVDC